jgi:hypothetical protein
VTGPSSVPRAEHTPRPGRSWEQQLVRAERLIDDQAPDQTLPNRATRRAMQRAARRNTK